MMVRHLCNSRSDPRPPHPPPRPVSSVPSWRHPDHHSISDSLPLLYSTSLRLICHCQFVLSIPSPFPPAPAAPHIWQPSAGSLCLRIRFCC